MDDKKCKCDGDCKGHSDTQITTTGSTTDTKDCACGTKNCTCAVSCAETKAEDAKVFAGEGSSQSKEEHVSIGKKEMKSLKKNKYGKVLEKFKNTFVIKNKKTGVIVELNAATMMHAVSLIGWRPRNTILIEEKVNV